jgi:hypothetical protein
MKLACLQYSWKKITIPDFSPHMCSFSRTCALGRGFFGWTVDHHHEDVLAIDEEVVCGRPDWDKRCPGGRSITFWVTSRLGKTRGVVFHVSEYYF